MSERYQIVSTDAKLDSKKLATLLAKDGQLLLPMLDLVEQAQCAIDDLVDVMGRATIEAILRMSAEQLAGPRQHLLLSQPGIDPHGRLLELQHFVRRNFQFAKRIHKSMPENLPEPSHELFVAIASKLIPAF